MHSKYQTKQSNVVYKSEWMTVYEDQVRDDVTSKVGVFNRIDVCDTAIVIPLFKDGSLLMVENYRHGRQIWCTNQPPDLVSCNRCYCYYVENPRQNTRCS